MNIFTYWLSIPSAIKNKVCQHQNICTVNCKLQSFAQGQAVMMELYDYVYDEPEFGDPETLRDCGETSTACEDNLDRSVAVSDGNTYQNVLSGAGNDIVQSASSVATQLFFMTYIK